MRGLRRVRRRRRYQPGSAADAGSYHPLRHALPAGKNKTKDVAITSLLQSVGFETVPKVS